LYFPERNSDIDVLPAPDSALTFGGNRYTTGGNRYTTSFGTAS